MPVTTPEIKIEAVKRLGGQVKLVGETYSETQAFAQVWLCHIHLVMLLFSKLLRTSLPGETGLGPHT